MPDDGPELSFIPPVQAAAGGLRLNFDDDERELIVRLTGELRDLLTSGESNALLDPLFPTVYTGDAAKEAEYQRLMRDELVASRLAALETVRVTVGPGAPTVIDEAEALAFMQAINALRIVLGGLLGIDEDDELDDDASPEHHLYAYLSWVLEWTVRSLSRDTSPGAPEE